MIYLQILYIILGIFVIICSVLTYFFQPKSSFFILKRIVEYLDESERINYQKAIAVPAAIIGIIVVILGIFFFGSDSLFKIFLGSYFVYLVWNMIINKRHLGYFFALSVTKKIF